MKNLVSKGKGQSDKSLQGHDTSLQIRVQKTQGRFNRIRNAKGPDVGVGEFFLFVDVAATKETVYIPISIASGKKPTGFIYQIEGTAQGTISTTNISCGGKGVTQIMLGTILYSKIPKGTTATFRILVEMRGQMNKTYKIVITRMNYKFDPSAARYEKLLSEISSTSLKFR